MSILTPTSWPTALVIAIDRGLLAHETEEGDLVKRAASVVLLVNGPKIIERDFSWIARHYKHIEEMEDGQRWYNAPGDGPEGRS